MSGAKIYFATHLKFIYKLLLYTGLIHFKYDESEEKFKQFKWSYLASRIVYRVMMYSYGIKSLCMLWAVIGGLFNFFYDPTMDETTINAQEKLLQMSQYILKIVISYMYSANYLRHDDSLLAVANDILRVFNKLKASTGSWIYFDASIQFLLVIEMYFLALRMPRDLRSIISFTIMFDVCTPYSYLVSVLMVVTWVYSQLVLICLYRKMNEFLALSCGGRRCRDVAKHIKKFIAISSRIHRIKRRLDVFYTVLFIGSYIGLFSDIYHTYETMKVLVYGKYIVANENWIIMTITFVTHCPSCMTFSFDIYLFGRLSDMLRESEEAFKSCVATLSNESGLEKDTHLQRAVEMMFMQDWMRGPQTLALEEIEMNREYAFHYIIEVIILNVITCLQYYASKMVYFE